MSTQNVIPSTTNRVPIDDRMIEQIQKSLGQTLQTTPQTIDQRLQQLDREWDIDRIYETTIGVLSSVGLILAVTANPWWLLVPAAAAVSLLAHGVFGWSVLLFLFRAVGVRTATEIAYERYALKALRGDFQQVASVMTPDDREAIAAFEGEGGNVHGPEISTSTDPKVVQEAIDAVQK